MAEKIPKGFDAADFPLEGGGTITFFVPSNMSEEEKHADANRQYDEWQTSQITAPKQKSVYESVQKPSVTSAIGAGLQKGGGDILAGLKQIGFGMQRIPFDQQAVARGNANLEQLAAEQAQREMAYAPIQKQRPIATGFGETIPELAVRNPLTVGLIEASKYAPTYGERGVRGATGGIAAKLGDIIGGKIGGYFNPDLTPSQISSMRGAEEIGVVPRLSETLGSREMGKLEDVVAQSPAGGALAQHQTRNQLAYNRAASKSIGEDSPYLTEDVLSTARAKIGQVYDAVGQTQVPIQFNQKVVDAADKIINVQKSAQRMKMREAQDPNLLAMAKAWKSMANSGKPFTGEEYKMTRENLSNLAWSAEGSAKGYYRDLLNALDDAAEQSFRSAGQDDLASSLQTARKQYANLKTLEKGNVISGGNVDISKLQTALKQGKESAFKEGKITGELNTLSKYSENFKPLREGSQTAQRTFYEMLLQNPYTQIPMAGVNALLAGTLTSPAASYIPRKMAGTIAGKWVEPAISRTGREAALQANQKLLVDRLFPKLNKSLLGE